MYPEVVHACSSAMLCMLHQVIPHHLMRARLPSYARYIHFPKRLHGYTNEQNPSLCLSPLQGLHSLIQLFRVLKRPPYLSRHIPKRLLEPFILILIRALHLCHIRHLPDINRLHPALIFPRNVTIRLGITLRAIAHT